MMDRLWMDSTRDRRGVDMTKPETNADTSDDTSIEIFFSYASDDDRIISEVLEDARFGDKVNARIWDYRDVPVAAGGLDDGLVNRIRTCDVFVAFISEAYSSKKTPLMEFNAALAQIADRAAPSKVR